MKSLIKLFIIVVIGITTFLYFGISSSILWVLFMSFALYDWNIGIIGILALISLVACPFLIQFKQDVIAEQMAVYAFFFLTITVILQIIEYKCHPERFNDEEK
jgi:hypothetical protein